jgi:hypothetical protein
MKKALDRPLVWAEQRFPADNRILLTNCVTIFLAFIKFVITSWQHLSNYIIL